MKLRRVLSFLLIFAVVLSVNFVGVYADEISGMISSDQTWSNGVIVNDATTISKTTTITVDGNVKIGAEITITGNVTIKGKGTAVKDRLVRDSFGEAIIKVENGGILNLENITIDGNDNYGETAISVLGGGKVFMNGGTFLVNHQKGSSFKGAAVNMSGGEFTMNGGEISGCNAYRYGGAVYLGDGSSFTMNSGMIKDNKTTDSNTEYGGGAFYVRRAVLTINGGTIQDNSSNCGGAIYNSSYGKTIINGGIIKNNKALGSDSTGAAIFHSCRQGNSSVLKIGGDANISENNDIYLMNDESANKYVEVTSEIKNPMKITVQNIAEGIIIAVASEGVTLTDNDMSKLSLTDSGYVLKLENNMIKLTKTTGENKKYPIYFGYDANGGIGAPDGQNFEIEQGETRTVTISSVKPERNGYIFKGWSVTKDSESAEYLPEEEITIGKSTTLYAVWEKIPVTAEINEFETELSIEGWTYGDTANKPYAKAKFGEAEYSYSDKADGKYSAIVPENAGMYYVKAKVKGTENYTSLESSPVSFEIKKKTLTSDNITNIEDCIYTGEEIKPVIELKDNEKLLELETDYTVEYENNKVVSDSAKVKVIIISSNYEGNPEKIFKIRPKTIDVEIPLKAPAKNELPQTEIDTEEFTATVDWTPEVSGKFLNKTVYTATIAITPKTNYTLDGIKKNSFILSKAESVANAENSGIVTVVYPATRSKSTSSPGSATVLYNVTFDTDGGSKITSKKVAENSKIGEPNVPTKDGLEFSGWYTDKECKEKYDFSSKVTKNITLYALWTASNKENSQNQIILTVNEKDASVFGEIKTNDVAPVIVNSRTMLPARFVAESLGAKVEWDRENKIVKITGKNEKDEDVVITIKIGDEYAYVNDKSIKLDSAAFIENDRTYSPIRFISENLGADVEWIEEDRKIIITKH